MMVAEFCAEFMQDLYSHSSRYSRYSCAAATVFDGHALAKRGEQVKPLEWPLYLLLSAVF